jgi:hypothetical protein
MLALADWSDDEGRCFPSVSSIAKKIRLSDRQTQRIVNGLIKEGFVYVEANKGGGAPGESRRYRIVLKRLTGVVSVTPTGDIGDVDGCHIAPYRGVTDVTLTVIEPSLTVNSGFDSFWKCYPKKKAKADALKAWKRLKVSPVLLSVILKAIDAQKESKEWLKESGAFIPYPATWLNARRWEDELSTAIGSSESSNQFTGAI